MKIVFPTPVGVFPVCAATSALEPGLPHARGGVSDIAARECRECGSSPRPWGCFLGYTGRWPSRQVFPTPVGVFLRDFSMQ